MVVIHTTTKISCKEVNIHRVSTEMQAHQRSRWASEPQILFKAFAEFQDSLSPDEYGFWLVFSISRRAYGVNVSHPLVRSDQAMSLLPYLTIRCQDSNCMD